MEAYTSFAAVYDEFMDNRDYEAWSAYVISLLKEYGIEDGLVLDLGCGTGSFTELLAKSGYDMIGIDGSPDMLQIAMERREKSGQDILYLCQWMQEFELYGTVRAIVSICDCMNYITEYEELVEVFRLVNNYLDPGGIFIFDINSLYKYEVQLAENTFAESRDDGSFIWENYYDREEKINEYNLTLFIEEENNLFRRYEEQHYQRAYSIEEIKKALSDAGMELEAVYHAFTREEVKEDSDRIYFIAREKGK